MAAADRGQRGAQSAPVGGPPGGARDPCGGAIGGDAAVAHSPESEVLAAETRDQLHAALRELRDEDREVIGARYFLGLSEAETAEALALPAGTVKSRTSRALGRLREALAAIEGGPADG